MTELRKGSCLCGCITYEVTGPLEGVTTCHCIQCRKQSGHYFAAVRTKASNFQISDPDKLLNWYRASDDASRGFCSKCGSAMFWKADGSEHLSVLAGSIDGDTNLTCSEHIFVEFKGDYYTLDDDVPRYSGTKPASQS